MSNSSFWPLSGDVMQAWTTMLRSMSQVGFVNVINETNSGDPELERKIVTEGFSYGRQLGRITDALEILVRQARRAGIGTEGDEKLAFDDFAEMATKVAAMKIGLPLSDDDLHEFVRRMKALRREKPDAYKRIRRQINRLQRALE
jgi:hypothetical protein